MRNLAAKGILFLLVLTFLGCGGGPGRSPTEIRFWAMGREGEVVQEMVRDFEVENSGVRVRVQQIPWTAAHEKLLTAYVGRSTPDVAQLGNTWIAEFVALHALAPLDTWIEATAALDSTQYFSGIWETNRIGNSLYGIPWYVDTRVLFYRRDILERAGFTAVPQNWSDWRSCMEAMKEAAGGQGYAILLPVNEWSPLAILGLQAGSPLLADNATRGAFSEAPFRRALSFYVDLFRSGLAPPVANTEIANLYQEFQRGYFSMYITGPWNLGEFRRRLPATSQEIWATSPLPGPDGPGVSLAGGSSLVLFRNSPHKEVVWRLVEFLSRPEEQLRFYRLTGDLPARRETWSDTALSRDSKIRTFGEQLQRVVPTPKVPEWELIATRLQERSELAVRGGVSVDSALALLDRDVDRILEKRRWLLQHEAPAAQGGGIP